MSNKYDLNLSKVLPHSSFLINLGSIDHDKHNKSKNLFLDELVKCDQLGIKMLNIHPGFAIGYSKSKAIKNIGDSINSCLEKTENVKVILECSAGQGTSVCSNFQEIKDLIDCINNKNRVGVCLDTCHLFAAGYDLRTSEAVIKTFSEYDRLVGYDKLNALHINDSKSTFGSKLDR